MSKTPATTTTGTPVKLDPVIASDEMRDNGVPRYVSTKHMCITGMKTYANKSLEELRVEDYTANRKAPQAGSTGFTFGSTSTMAVNKKGSMFPTSQLGVEEGERSRAAPRRRNKLSQLGGLTQFGSATVQSNSESSDTASSPFTFGSTSTSTSNTTSSSLFGGGEQRKSSSFLGAGAKPSTGFLFGSGAPVTVTSSSVGTDSAQSSPLFGTTTQTAFGQPAAVSSMRGGTPVPAFGATITTQQSSGFSFGAVTSPASTPSFGSKVAGLFEASTQQSVGAFGSKPATGEFSFGFGSQPSAGTATSTGGWMFGSNTAPAPKPLFGSATTLGIGPGSQPAQAADKGPSNKKIDGVCEFKTQCSGCGYWEPMERARICDTCSKACALEEKNVVAEQEKMAPFVFCSSCAIDEHMGKGHEVSKYLPWKNRLLMNACSEAACGRVNNIGDLCMSEWENGRKLLDEWKEVVSCAVGTGNALSTAMRCKILAGSCDRHANTIYEELDGKVLPTLRAFSQTVRMATDDLKTDTTCALLEEQKVQNAEEPELATKEAEAEITNSQPSERTPVPVVEPAAKEAEAQNTAEPNKGEEASKPEGPEAEDTPVIVPDPVQVSA